ncbi:hypothetical protein GUITHDRAFT_147324 [Guillardia theta CCMP2712]|uniref:Uncharacterized protein n=1 Tax=Guillardia theta (strain CCMP2712) TaxID=905079 RepID=L1IDJ8_GUITC|nr:hypothetical protein GUITHDRAFT_147324 [Guillardia theta CCMP2712]EKX34288.1 hypothetical protein GUITHDRAFT_147324 [Guillardia theta CCMP2712]|eukprot:XP_005821268.1 hypothetical protein GUITHDRAFT_147324 [Guillardia theta CCMP2712]
MVETNLVEELRSKYSSSETPRKEGYQQPRAGYSGHVPGLVALNLHGATWLSLMQSVKGAQTTRNVVDELNNSSPARKMLPLGSKEVAASLELGKRLEGTKTSRPGSTTSRSSKRWSPPVAGYTGHVPGYVARNMHGASWKILLSPRVVPADDLYGENASSGSESGKSKGSVDPPKIPKMLLGYLRKSQSR